LSWTPRRVRSHRRPANLPAFRSASGGEASPVRCGVRIFESGQDVDTVLKDKKLLWGGARAVAREGRPREELGHGIWEAKRPSFRFVADFSLQGFGTEFDFVLAQSVFSHTLPALLRLGLRNIARSLAPSGKVFATWNEAASGKGGPSIGPTGRILPNGWVHKGVYIYPWENMQYHLQESGLVRRRLRWPHPRQFWFVAARPENESSIDEFSHTIRSPRPGWGKGRSHSRNLASEARE